jgi:hypothetical protein
VQVGLFPASSPNKVAIIRKLYVLCLEALWICLVGLEDPWKAYLPRYTGTGVMLTGLYALTQFLHTFDKYPMRQGELLFNRVQIKKRMTHAVIIMTIYASVGASMLAALR